MASQSNESPGEFPREIDDHVSSQFPALGALQAEITIHKTGDEAVFPRRFPCGCNAGNDDYCVTCIFGMRDAVFSDPVQSFW